MKIHKPDLAVAYAALAPLVREAAILVENGEYAEAERVMKEADAIVKRATDIIIEHEPGDKESETTK